MYSNFHYLLVNSHKHSVVLHNIVGRMKIQSLMAYPKTQIMTRYISLIQYVFTASFPNLLCTVQLLYLSYYYFMLLHVLLLCELCIRCCTAKMLGICIMYQEEYIKKARQHNNKKSLLTLG